ncbi:MAG: hypothetical protein V1887_01675 [Candidatus Aenigmatarchaeota archaeon]
MKQFAIRKDDFGPKRIRSCARTVDGLMDVSRHMVGDNYKNEAIGARPYAELVAAAFEGTPLPEQDLEQDVAYAIHDFAANPRIPNYMLSYAFNLGQVARAYRAIRTSPELQRLAPTLAAVVGGTIKTSPAHYTQGEVLLDMLQRYDGKSALVACRAGISRAREIYGTARSEIRQGMEDGFFTYRALGLKKSAGAKEALNWVKENTVLDSLEWYPGLNPGEIRTPGLRPSGREVKLITDSVDARELVGNSALEVAKRKFRKRIDPLYEVCGAAVALDAAKDIDPLYHARKAAEMIDRKGNRKTKIADNPKNPSGISGPLDAAISLLERRLKLGDDSDPLGIKALVKSRMLLGELHDRITMELDGKLYDDDIGLRNKVRKFAGHVGTAGELLARPLTAWTAVVAGSYCRQHLDGEYRALYGIVSPHIGSECLDKVVFEFEPEGRMGGVPYGARKASFHGEGPVFKSTAISLPPEMNSTVHALWLAKNLFMPVQPKPDGNGNVSMDVLVGKKVKEDAKA